MSADFTPLRVHSHGSLLYGTASPEALIERALEAGCRALALTDRGNLYLAIRFWQRCHTDGLRPLLGATLAGGADEALLIAADRTGYASLCALLTALALGDRRDRIATIAAHAAGLHVIVETAPAAAALRAAGVPAADPAGGVWLGIRGLAAERTRLAERVAAAARIGVPLVATGDVVLLAASDHEAHRVAVTAAAGELLGGLPPTAFAAPDAWFASPTEWTRRVRAVCASAAVPEAAEAALAGNRALAGGCRLTLELGVPIFPEAQAAAGTTGLASLRAQCEAGVIRRYGRADPSGLARLATELAMIDRLGFTDYFLLVAEIVEFCRVRGIPSVGRGSGASSIVAYTLGITNVDPLRYGLAFERFLNPSRRDCPDLDIDLCWRRRDEVIAHVYDAYGADRVAMISTHATLGARSAFRETAKVLGVPNPRVNELARRIPHELSRPYAVHLGAFPEARRVDWNEPVLARALALAERLDGAPRHLSIHSGGVVIADRPLIHYVPLERAAKGVVVTQFEMRAIEAIGLVKMDLLGNRALSTIGECVELVRAHRGVVIDVDHLPEADLGTRTRLAAGDTLNCFQLESPAMRHLLRMLDARTLDDVIAAVALVRPGPAESGMKEAFCRRRRGLEPAVFAHPRLRETLAATYGVLLYEEDVMHVAAALMGLSLAEGDDLRRAIGAVRSDEEFRSLEHGFVAHAARAAVDPAAARQVWRDLTRFAAYSFCKAHAAGYGTLGHQSAYLKTHFPAEYAVGILNHHAGMYPTWVHVEDLRRQGVRFRAPCARRSAWDSTYEEAQVRVGLARVAGLKQATGARVIAARAERDWSTLADFIDRVGPTLPELESLILAGALDWTRRTRPSLLLEARVTAAPGRPARAPRPAGAAVPGRGVTALLPEAAAPRGLVELPEFDLARRVRGECRATGLWFSAHPLDVWSGADATRDATPAMALERHVGRRVAVCGLACARRRVETKAGDSMLFLTLADRTGLAECVLFPGAYRRSSADARDGIVRVEGVVDDTLGALTVNVERVRRIAPGTDELAESARRFAAR